jgi:hypothetical protein
MSVRKFAAPFLLVVACSAAGQEAPETFRKQWPDFRYLKPGQLRALPAAIRDDLEKLGCRIPMFTRWDGKHNAVQGQFLRAGQRDWAVLCRAGDNTGILLYPAGEATGLPMLHVEPGDPRRMIHAVSGFVLSKRAVRDRPDQPAPVFDHDGIEDGPIQGAAKVLYFRNSDWEVLGE